ILNADRDPREGTPFGGDMSHKVTLRSMFVLAVALGIVSVTARMKDVPDVRPQQPPANSLARPLASFRVYEDPSDGAINYRGANYRGRVAAEGSVFGPVPELNSITAPREFSVEFGAPRLQQGAIKLELTEGKVVRAAFGVGQVDRGQVVEEYVFENG